MRNFWIAFSGLVWIVSQSAHAKVYSLATKDQPIEALTSAQVEYHRQNSQAASKSGDFFIDFKDEIRFALSRRAKELCKAQGHKRALLWSKKKLQDGSYVFTQLNCTNHNDSDDSESDESLLNDNESTISEFEDISADTEAPYPPSTDDSMSIKSETSKIGGWSEWAWNIMPSREDCVKSGSEVLMAMVCAMKKSMESSNPLNPASLNPLNHLGAGLAAGLATAAAEGYHFFYKDSEASGMNLADVIEQAKVHLEKASGSLSDKQKKVALSWIEEARKGLILFREKHERDLKSTTSARKLKVSEKEKPKTETEETEPRAAWTVSSVSKAESESDLTFGKLMEQIQKASDARRPTAEHLKHEDENLLNVLLALIQFTNIPYEIQKTSSEEVLKRIRSMPALGSESFVQSLERRAQMIAENASKPLGKQEKKILIGASGPGTGKTQGIKLMAEWVRMPVCELTGETAQRAELKDGQTMYQWIIAWLQNCMMKELRVERPILNQGQPQYDTEGKPLAENIRVINGLILFDDFHTVLNGPNGKLYLDSTSRQQFFDLLKNLGDTTQPNPLDVEFAPGRPFPLNTGRLETAMTLNSFPPELKPEGEIGQKYAPLQSRINDLQPNYPDESDRIFIARKFWGNIRSSLVELKKGEEALRDLDEKECLLRIEEVAAVDIEYFVKSGRQLGMRGLMDLLSGYKAHVIERASEHSVLTSKICAFTDEETPSEEPQTSDGKHAIGPDKPKRFNPATVAIGIRDYKKEADRGMLEEERSRLFLTEIAEMKARAQTLFDTDREWILTRIEKLEKSSSTARESKVNELDQIRFRFEIASNRIRLPEAREIGPAVQKYFSARASDLEPIIVHLYEKLESARRTDGTKVSIPNHLIQISATRSGYDPGLHEKVSSVLSGGAQEGIPVCRITSTEELFSSPSKNIGFDLQDARIKILIDSKRFNETLPRKLEDSGKAYLYYGPIKGQWQFVRVETADEMMEGTHGSENLDHFVSIPSHISGLSNILSFANRRNLILFERCFKQWEKQPSIQDGLFVIQLNPEIKTAIEAYMKERTPSIAVGSELLTFQRELHKVLNSSELVLRSGMSINPRQLTLLFEGDQKLSPLPSDLGLTVALKEIGTEERKQIADQKIISGLSEIKTRLTKAGIQSSEKLELTETESKLLSQLVAFDLEWARKAKEMQIELPITPLEQSVDVIIRIANNRLDNRFGFERKPLSEAAFLEKLESLYEEPLRLIKNSILQREQEAEIRRMHEIQQERLKQQKGREREIERIRLLQQAAAAQSHFDVRSKEI